jgi:rod shape-determining protein MreB and related proteins
MAFLDLFKDKIGIDPGSNHFRIIKDNQVVFNEPSQISIDKNTNITTGLGNSIKQLDKGAIINPIDCAIADFYGFEILLRGAMKKGLSSNSIIPKSYSIFFSIPTNTTEIEKRAYRDSAEHAGASEIHMVYQSCCAAVSLNLLFERKNFIVVDFGSSKIEMTVFANSLIISAGVIRMGTAKIYRIIKNFLKRKYKVIVTNKEVDSILTELNNSNDEIKILHTTVKVSEIDDLLNTFFVIVNDEFVETIERVSGHGDIEKVLTTGVYFTGGGSIIAILRKKIIIDTRIKSTISQNPLLDNINGLKTIMTDRNTFKNYILS